jgi:SEC-C motif-containing protein
MKCPCDSGKPFENCCEPFINGEKQPETAEALMRSRYTAYTRSDIGYLKRTLAKESQKDFDEKSSKEWAAKSEWLGLKVLSTQKGSPEDRTGIVEFTATYKQNGSTVEHHEVSKFKKNAEGEWRFLDGDSHVHKEGEGHHHHHHATEPVVREGPKVGRNDPCPCGSGKKYKKCHGA